MSIACRHAGEADFPALAALANANGRGDPAVMARGEGFLTGQFDAGKFALFDLGIWLAEEQGALAGFVCAASSDRAAEVPIDEAMLAGCVGATLDGRPLLGLRLFCYGPVCVAAPWRGRGVLRRLYTHLRHEQAGRFDAGVLFVACDNPHSLAAHEQGLGMSRVSGFSFAGHAYHTLAFRCDG